MSCKYPKGSRSYKCCIGCSSKYICQDSTFEYDVEIKPPKDILPSASQASQMTKENIENCCTQELIEITKKINKAIADGKFSISGNGSLKHGIVEKLKGLGYKVETGCPMNDPYWIISWK